MQGRDINFGFGRKREEEEAYKLERLKLNDRLIKTKQVFMIFVSDQNQIDAFYVKR